MKTLKKRSLSLLCCLCMLLSLIPAGAFGATVTASGYCGGEGDGTNLSWTLDSDGLLTISGTGKMEDYPGYSVAPWYSKRSSVKCVTIGNGVTSIGYGAFGGCTSLTSVTIGNGVTSIGDDAFDSCFSLTSVTIPSSVTSIGEDAFEYCISLTSVTIPNSVTSIGDGAFLGCDSLTSVTIGDGVTSIGGAAFDYCSKLQFNVAGNAKYLGNAANPYLVLFEATSTSIASCDIQPGCKVIAGDAFFECTSLTSVTIPNSVTSIGDDAFCGCDSLASVTIPNSVTSIGSGVFCDCDSLTSVTIPSSVTSIGAYAFDDCDSLTSVTIPDSVTSIGDKAFYSCDSLTSVTFSGNAPTEVGSNVFKNCASGFTIHAPKNNSTWTTGAAYNAQAHTWNGYPIVFGDTTTPITTTGFRMGVDSLGFNNDGVGYGDNAYYINLQNYARLMSLANPIEKLTIDCSILNDGVFSTNFGGECFGATSVMALLYEGSLQASKYGASNTFRLPRPADSEKTASLIYYYQLLQFMHSFKSEDKGKTQFTMGKELIDALKSTENPVIVNIEGEESSKKFLHSILAYAVDVNSDTDDYLVYIADPNQLIYRAIPNTPTAYQTGDPMPPAVLSVSKSTYKITNYETRSIYDPEDKRHPYQNLSFISIISDLDSFSPYSIEGRQKSSGNSIFNIITVTGTSNLVIAAGGKSAVINGDSISGDLTVYPTYGNLNGTADDTRSYCVESASSYTITYPDNNSSRTTTCGFSGSTGSGGIVNSDASTVTFASNGTVSINNADSESSVAVAAESNYKNWYAVEAVAETSNLTVTPGANSCNISSAGTLGDFEVVGIADWQTRYTLNATTGENSVVVKEELEGSNAAYLVVADDNNQEIAREQVSSGGGGGSSSGGGGGGGGGGSAAPEETPKTESPATGTVAFTDVPANAYYTEPVKWAVENGVTAGKTATSFAPNASCTRAQVVTFLWRAAGMPTPKSKANFTDVPADAYYAQAVAWAAENGITGGKTATTFAPNATVSRAQVVTFLYRLAGNGAKGTNVFTDVPANAYYTDAVSWAVANGITEGKTQATFAPDASCTRAQIVTFLYRHFAK